MLHKTLEITETLANGYSSQSTQHELSNEYQHGSVHIVSKDFCILVSCTKVASAFKELNTKIQENQIYFSPKRSYTLSLEY